MHMLEPASVVDEDKDIGIWLLFRDEPIRGKFVLLHLLVDYVRSGVEEVARFSFSSHLKQ